MKHKKKSLILLLVAVVIGIVGYNYLYQDHRDIQSEKPVFKLFANELIKSFKEDEREATKKYLNKTLLITGTLTAIEQEFVTLDHAAFFALNEIEIASLKEIINTTVSIKGRCIGYDNLLEEVKFDQSTIQL